MPDVSTLKMENLPVKMSDAEKILEYDFGSFRDQGATVCHNDLLQVIGAPFGRASKMVRRNSGDQNQTFPNQEILFENMSSHQEQSTGNFEEERYPSNSGNMKIEQRYLETNGFRDYQTCNLPHPSKLRKRKRENYFQRDKSIGSDVTSHFQQLHHKKKEYGGQGIDEVNSLRNLINPASCVHIFRGSCDPPDAKLNIKDYPSSFMETLPTTKRNLAPKKNSYPFTFFE